MSSAIELQRSKRSFHEGLVVTVLVLRALTAVDNHKIPDLIVIPVCLIDTPNLKRIGALETGRAGRRKYWRGTEQKKQQKSLNHKSPFLCGPRRREPAVDVRWASIDGRGIMRNPDVISLLLLGLFVKKKNRDSQSRLDSETLAADHKIAA